MHNKQLYMCEREGAYVCLHMNVCAWWIIDLLFKITAQQLYSHGDGVCPALREDSDEAGEDGRIDVVLHMVIVICIAKENLDLVREKEDKSQFPDTY